MTQLINVKPEDSASKEKELFFCRELEKGNILFFLKTPFAIASEEIAFLQSQKEKETDRLKEILETYSAKVTEFLSQVLPS